MLAFLFHKERGEAMSIFMPDYSFHSALDLTPGFLKEHQLSAVLLDVDNTLAVYGKPEPAPGILEWIQMLKQDGISVIIVSNNTKERVAPFAGQLGLDFICWGCKPLGFGIRKACRKLGVTRRDAAMVGDQILTDIVGGNLQRMTTILVEPFELEQSPLFKIKRRWERRYRERSRARKEG